MSEKEMQEQEVQTVAKVQGTLSTEQEAAQDKAQETAREQAGNTAAEDRANAPLKDTRGGRSRKKKKWIKWVVIGAAAAAGVFIFRQRSGSVRYETTTAQLRDIQTSRSFTGTIEPVSQQSIMPDITGVRIEKLEVDLGDTVKKGDVIAELNRSSIEQQIKEMKAQMAASGQSASVSQQLANKNYSDYKSDIDNGLNAQILQATQAIDSAMSQLVSAQQAYNNEVGLNNAQLSQTMLGAMQAVDQAYSSVRAAELQAGQANKALDRTKNRPDSDFVGTSRQDALDSAQNTADSAGLSVESAWTSYNNAVTNFQAAKIQEENALTGAYDALVTAEIGYLNALDAYNVTLNGVREQLETYALQVRQAELGTNDEVSELKLAHLEESLNDCTVRAAADGVITELNVKEGDLVSATSAMATITSFDRMKVSIKINEYDISGAAEGSPVTIRVDALGTEYQGTISRISRTATVQNGVSYFESEVRFDADDAIRTGMSVEVKLVVSDVSQAVSVPSSFVKTKTDGSAYVEMYESDGKTVKQQPVEVGVTDGIYTEIKEGLADGDTVVDTTPSADYLTGNAAVETADGEVEE